MPGTRARLTELHPAGEQVEETPPEPSDGRRVPPARQVRLETQHPHVARQGSDVAVPDASKDPDGKVVWEAVREVEALACVLPHGALQTQGGEQRAMVRAHDEADERRRPQRHIVTTERARTDAGAADDLAAAGGGGRLE